MSSIATPRTNADGYATKSNKMKSYNPLLAAVYDGRNEMKEKNNKKIDCRISFYQRETSKFKRNTYSYWVIGLTDCLMEILRLERMLLKTVDLIILDFSTGLPNLRSNSCPVVCPRTRYCSTERMHSNRSNIILHFSFCISAHRLNVSAADSPTLSTHLHLAHAQVKW